MQLSSIALFVALACALSVQATVTKAQKAKCMSYADKQCPHSEEVSNGDAYRTWYSKCMKNYWQTLSKNTKCPHPDVGCTCYNGCVVDSWRDTQDVGRYCTTRYFRLDLCPSARAWCNSFPQLHSSHLLS
ncbi:hypothetical protein V8E36_006913 [Tilletia maclaganii]